MMIGGFSIILILGIVNLVLVLFQLSTGLKWIKVPFRVHRVCGILLVICAILHALLAFLADTL